MPHKKKLVPRVASAMNRQKALQMASEHIPLMEIAQRLGLQRNQVMIYLRQALASESIFPSSLSSERVSEMRQFEGENLRTSARKLNLALNNALKIMVESSEEEIKLSAVLAVARCVESNMRISERIARMYGLDVPTRIATSSLNINLEQREDKMTISFDAGVLEEPVESVAGMQIYEGGNQERLVEGSEIDISEKIVIAQCEEPE